MSLQLTKGSFTSVQSTVCVVEKVVDTRVRFQEIMSTEILRNSMSVQSRSSIRPTVAFQARLHGLIECHPVFHPTAEVFEQNICVICVIVDYVRIRPSANIL